MQSIVDWEIGEAKALQNIEEKWTHRLWASDRDTSLFVGNQFRNPDGFLVPGVYGISRASRTSSTWS